MSEIELSKTTVGMTPKQELALHALLDGATITEAAKAAGVKRGTVSGWRNHDVVFQSTLNSQRAELRDSIRSRVEASVSKAVTVLTELLDDENSRTRLLAAKALLAHAAPAIPNQPESNAPGLLPHPSTFTGEDANNLREAMDLSPGQRETCRQLLTALVEGAKRQHALKESVVLSANLTSSKTGMT